MSYPADCPACIAGDHNGHDAAHGTRKGLIGGNYCACTGDCAERAAAAFAKAFPVTASDARPPSDVCACRTPGETHSPTIHARPPSDTGDPDPFPNERDLAIHRGSTDGSELEPTRKACLECGHLGTHAGHCTQVGRKSRELETGTP